MQLSSLSILAVAGLISLAGPALATSAITVGEAGFSAGPGTDYGPAKTLTVGTHVDVIWCGTHENWCLVDIHNKRGWVPLASLTFKIPRASAVDDTGTPGGGTTASGPTAPAAGPSGTKTKDMAQGLNPGNSGGGIKFAPVNNYNLVKTP